MKKTINPPNKIKQLGRYLFIIICSNILFYAIICTNSSQEETSLPTNIPADYQITILPLQMRVANLNEEFPVEASLIDEHQLLRVKHAIILGKESNSLEEEKWQEHSLFKLAIPASQLTLLAQRPKSLLAIPPIPSKLQKYYLPSRIRYEINF